MDGNNGGRPEVILGERGWREGYVARSIFERLREKDGSLLYFSNEKDGVFQAVSMVAPMYGYETWELWIPTSDGMPCVDPVRYADGPVAAWAAAANLATGADKEAECALLASCIVHVSGARPEEGRTMAAARSLLDKGQAEIDELVEEEYGACPALRAGKYLDMPLEKRERAVENIREDLESCLPFIGRGGGRPLDFAELRRRNFICHVHTLTPMRAAGKVAGAILTAAVQALFGEPGRQVDLYLQADGLMADKEDMEWIPMAGCQAGISTKILADDAGSLGRAFTRKAVEYLARQSAFTREPERARRAY